MGAELPLRSLIQHRVREGAALLSAVGSDTKLLKKIEDVSDLLVETFKRGNKLLLFGNGGSAADSIHIAGEFAGRFMIDRRPLPAISLCENIASVTAIGNDYGFDQVFARQVKAFGSDGDLALGLTTSGHSRNVILGLTAATEADLSTVALTGQDTESVRSICNHVIDIPSVSTPQIQQAHMLVAHVLCEWVELQLVEGQF